MSIHKKTKLKSDARNHPPAFEIQSPSETAVQKIPEAAPRSTVTQEKLREYLGPPTTPGKNLCCSLNDAIDEIICKFDHAANGDNSFLSEIKRNTKSIKILKLFICKMIFQGKIVCGVKGRENFVTLIRGINHCYDNFCNKSKNIANLPLDALSIFCMKNSEKDEFEDIFKDFLQYLNIEKRQGHGILFSLSDKNPAIFSDCIKTNINSYKTPPVRIAKNGEDRYVSLVGRIEKNHLFFCTNAKGNIVELPVSMHFCTSFAKLLNVYDPRCPEPAEPYKEGRTTLLSMAGGFFLLFLKSHGMLNDNLFSKQKKLSIIDENIDFVNAKVNNILEFFDRHVFLYKKSLDSFLEDINIFSKLEEYIKKPMIPFFFEKKHKKAGILQDFLESNKNTISADDLLIIEAEIDRSNNNLGIKQFYEKYGEKILVKEKDHEKNFWGRFNYKLKSILNKNKIDNYSVFKFSHKKTTQKHFI